MQVPLLFRAGRLKVKRRFENTKEGSFKGWIPNCRNFSLQLDRNQRVIFYK